MFLNTLWPRQSGRHFADDILKCTFLNENVSIAIKISLKFVPKGPVNNISVLVQIMAWRRPGNKPLSEPMMVSLPTHIYASLSLNELKNIFQKFLKVAPTFSITDGTILLITKNTSYKKAMCISDIFISAAARIFNTPYMKNILR